MERFRFRKLLLVCLAVCTVVLSGCAELEIRTEINRDLSGKLSFTLGMPEGVRKFLVSQGRDPFEGFDFLSEWSEDENVTVEQEIQAEEDKVWAVQTLMIKDLAAYGRAITKDNNDPYLLVERRPSLFWDIYRYHWRSSALGPEEGVELPEDLKELELSDILTARWVTVLPGKVTSHNGDSHNPDIGEIVWILNVGEQTEYDFEATSRTLHPVRILLVAGGFVGICLGLVAVLAFVVVMARRWAGEGGGF